MKSVQADIMINGSVEAVWKVISDIAGSVNVISGIEKIEVLERPEAGLTGLKWKETRTMFGQTATEVMWITEAEENRFYATRAESHGSVYISRLSIEEKDGVSLLTFDFSAEFETIGAKIMSFLTGWLFASATVKAIMQDLEDIKKAVEAS